MPILFNVKYQAEAAASSLQRAVRGSDPALDASACLEPLTRRLKLTRTSTELGCMSAQ